MQEPLRLLYCRKTDARASASQLANSAKMKEPSTLLETSQQQFARCNASQLAKAIRTIFSLLICQPKTPVQVLCNLKAKIKNRLGMVIYSDAPPTASCVAQCFSLASVRHAMSVAICQKKDCSVHKPTHFIEGQNLQPFTLL